MVGGGELHPPNKSSPEQIFRTYADFTNANPTVVSLVVHRKTGQSIKFVVALPHEICVLRWCMHVKPGRVFDQSQDSIAVSLVWSTYAHARAASVSDRSPITQNNNCDNNNSCEIILSDGRYRQFWSHFARRFEPVVLRRETLNLCLRSEKLSGVMGPMTGGGAGNGDFKSIYTSSTAGPADLYLCWGVVEACTVFILYFVVADAILRLAASSRCVNILCMVHFTPEGRVTNEKPVCSCRLRCQWALATAPRDYGTGRKWVVTRMLGTSISEFLAIHVMTTTAQHHRYPIFVC